MSSECRCHTDVYCFYCDMYAPLERKYEDERALNAAIGVEREEWGKEIRKMRAIAELAVKALDKIEDLSTCKWTRENAGKAIDEIKRISAEGVSGCDRN